MVSDLGNRRHFVLAGCFIGMFVATPAVFAQCFGLYFPKLLQETGWNRTIISSGFSIASLGPTLIMPIAGHFLDRFGSRPLILIGTAFFPLALLAWGLVPLTITSWYILSACFGVSMALVSAGSYLTLPPQWFPNSLGLASGISNLGGALGGIIWPLITTTLLGLMDWRSALLIIAGIVAVIGLANALLLIKDNPDQAKLAGEGAGDNSVTLKEALRSPTFYGLAATFFLIVLGGGAYLVHLTAILQAEGFPAKQAALSMVAFGIGSLIGRLIGGLMLDRWPYWISGVVFLGGQALGAALLLGNMQGVTPFFAAALIGAALGAEADIIPVTLRHFFGWKAFGRIFAAAFAILTVGGAIGPILMGLSFDLLGSYYVGQLGSVFVAIAALVIFVLTVKAAAPAAHHYVKGATAPES